jgi:hypothetical protein
LKKKEIENYKVTGRFYMIIQTRYYAMFAALEKNMNNLNFRVIVVFTVRNCIIKKYIFNIKIFKKAISEDMNLR